jgi:hypothetical protein
MLRIDRRSISGVLDLPRGWGRRVGPWHSATTDRWLPRGVNRSPGHHSNNIEVAIEPLCLSSFLLVLNTSYLSRCLDPRSSSLLLSRQVSFTWILLMRYSDIATVVLALQPAHDTGDPHNGSLMVNMYAESETEVMAV